MTNYKKQYNNIRIVEKQTPITPIEVIKKYSLSKENILHTQEIRSTISDIMTRKDKRVMVVIGPCSIHDTKSAFEYAQKLAKIKNKLSKQLFIVMRVYFEKPRTIVGWKGLIYDPDLNNSFNINKGLKKARLLLRDIANLKLGTATEFLDLITPQYFADLISCGTIGARTTESQIHRELASGLSCPVGFKNTTHGDIDVAIDAVFSASKSHMFWAISKDGIIKRYKTTGNTDCHIILRGGGGNSNYDAKNIENTCQQLKNKNLAPYLMVDFSHDNSQKKFKNQLIVAEEIIKQIKLGSYKVFGVMIESNLVEGRQNIAPLDKLTYGQSITDSCLGWDDSVVVLEQLAEAVKYRQNKT